MTLMLVNVKIIILFLHSLTSTLSNSDVPNAFLLLSMFEMGNYFEGNIKAI